MRHGERSKGGPSGLPERTDDKMAKVTTAGTVEKADRPAKAAKPSKPAKPNVFARFVGYLRDVRSEMKRVVWPNRSEVINSSLVVVTTLIFFTVFITLTDLIVQRVVFLIQTIGG
jgi:preprotein translocase subunit SecE